MLRIKNSLDQLLLEEVTPNRAPVILNPTLATYRTGSLGPFLSPFFPLGTREGGRNLQGRSLGDGMGEC